MTKRITEDMAGCWLDGHYGWTNHYRVVDRAQEWGFQIDADEQKLVDVYRLNDDESEVLKLLLADREGDMPTDADRREAEGLIEDAADVMLGQGGLVDKATEYLDSLAPEGMAFYWDMGELSLLCLCQIEGTEENEALMKTDKYHCGARWHR